MLIKGLAGHATLNGVPCQIIIRPLKNLVKTNARSMATESKVPVKTQSDDSLTKFHGKEFPDFDTAYRKRGTGGRSSFSGITATIFGTSGIVGKRIIPRLAKSGTQIVSTYRGSRYFEEKYRMCGDLGQIYLSKINLKDDETLYNAMKYSNVVINLIGVWHPTSNYSWEAVHVDGPRRIARIANQLGIKKLIHFSSINANPNPKGIVLKGGSPFLKSKYYGELAVKEEFPDAIIFRPSDIIGESDNFITHFNLFRRNKFICAGMPIWDNYHEVEKQPVSCADVIDGIERAIYNDSVNGQIIQAVGPYRYDFYELIEYVRACGGRARADGHGLTNLRYDIIMRLWITYLERTKKYPFITWDRCERESHSDYVDPNLLTLEDLGVKLTPVEKLIEYVGFFVPREHRFETSFETREIHPLPRRLNELQNDIHAATV